MLLPSMLLTSWLSPPAQAQEAYRRPELPGEGWFGESGNLSGRLGDGDEERGRRGTQVERVPFTLMSGLSGKIFISTTVDGASFSLVSPTGDTIPLTTNSQGTIASQNITAAEPGVWTAEITAPRKVTGSYRVGWSMFGPEEPPKPNAGLCETLDYLTAQAHVDFKAVRSLDEAGRIALLPGLEGWYDGTIRSGEIRMALPAQDAATAGQSYEQAAAVLAPCQGDFTVIDEGWMSFSIRGSGELMFHERRLVYAEQEAVPRGQIAVIWSDFANGSQSVSVVVYEKTRE